MHSKLSGTTIVLTGSSPTQSVQSLIEANGGKCYSFPLISTQEVICDDAQWFSKLADFSWLIFTSQNAVQVFFDKCVSHHIDASHIHCKIAAVGEKTAALLEQHGLTVSFMPSIYSADVFVQEFPKVSQSTEKKCFIRGSLAKPTIVEGIQNVEEWTVYETVTNEVALSAFTELLKKQSAIVIFASPSAVQVFHEHIASVVGWTNVRAAAIGHITANTLQSLDVAVYVQPKVYTMQAVVEEIILLEEQP